MRQQLVTYLLASLILGCAGTKSGNSRLDGAVSPPVVELPPPPPLAEAAPSLPPPPPAPAARIELMAQEQVDSGPIYYERIVYRTRPASPAPPAIPVAVGVCATCPGCPDCAPVVNVNTAAPEKESIWKLILAAFGGAASVLLYRRPDSRGASKYWGRRVTCVYVKDGLFFEKDGNGRVRIVQRENDSPVSHTYFVIDLAPEDWCRIARVLCCGESACGEVPSYPVDEVTAEYELPPLKRPPSEG